MAGRVLSFWSRRRCSGHLSFCAPLRPNLECAADGLQGVPFGRDFLLAAEAQVVEEGFQDDAAEGHGGGFGFDETLDVPLVIEFTDAGFDVFGMSDKVGEAAFGLLFKCHGDAGGGVQGQVMGRVGHHGGLLGSERDFLDRRRSGRGTVSSQQKFLPAW